MATPSPPAEFAVRPAGPDDLDAAYRVFADATADRDDELQLSRGMLGNLFEIGRGVVAESAAGVVGAGVVNRDFGRLWVLRAARRRGLGTSLLRALEAEWAGDVLRFAASTLAPAAAPFLAANGYEAAWQVWLLGIHLREEPPAPIWPEGVAVRTFDPADAPAVKRLLDEAYAGEPDCEPLPFEDWCTFMLGDPSYDPTAWFLAVAGGETVGAALSWKEGYVKDLVVSPRWRRRGLGRALMLETFAEFRRRGVEHVALKTESINPTEAVRLYEQLGMAVEETFEVFERQLSAGSVPAGGSR